MANTGGTEMSYPAATREQIERFESDGYLIVENVVPAEDLNRLREMAEGLTERRKELCLDWDWRRGESRDARAYRIVQCGVSDHAPWIPESRLRKWSAKFSSDLMGGDMLFWYDQFLGKPPGFGAPTPWHQDEAYWGRHLADKGITCWMSFHDVDERNGCMHFAPGAHKRGMIEHRNPREMASDLLVCELPQDMQIVAARIKAGSVTFHHSKMPHMTTGNSSGAWRLTMAQHFSAPGCQREGDHYAWRVHVNQRTGERFPWGRRRRYCRSRTTLRSGSN
jgi:phytanoyl-CoA hydroxylase